MVYLADVVVQPLCKIAGRTELYRRRWERYLAFLESVRDMCRLVETDITGAAEIWNSVDQTAADAAVSSMLCEREPFPRVNLATMAQRHFGLASRATPDIGVRHRKANDRDHQAAWDVAVDGGCASCGSPTISQHQYDRLTKTMRTHPDLFDLSPTYRQHSGKIAPIWSARLVIAAKGVADHIIPRSQNGPTCADNLANVCAACNYSRNDSSLDDVRVAAYTSPRSGSSLPTVNSG